MSWPEASALTTSTWTSLRRSPARITPCLRTRWQEIRRLPPGKPDRSHAGHQAFKQAARRKVRAGGTGCRSHGGARAADGARHGHARVLPVPAKIHGGKSRKRRVTPLPGRFCRYNIDNMEETTSILALGAGGISKCVMREEEKILRAPNIANIEQYIDRVDEMIERKRTVFAEKAKKLD